VPERKGYIYLVGLQKMEIHQNFELILPPVSVAIVQRHLDSNSAGIGATGKVDPNKTCRQRDLGKEYELKHIWREVGYLGRVSAQVIKVNGSRPGI
jgi:hypothetical protein